MFRYGIAILVIVVLVYQASGCSSRCIRSCKGLPDGKYQSCKGCGFYVRCCHGFLFTVSCRRGNVWDDFFKRCQRKSSTCPTPASNPCITNCTGVPDGVYQSCKDCHLYAVCYHGITHVKRCSHGTVWDDSLKRCQKTSKTCKIDPVPNRCISDCTGVPPGDYQSCLGCHVYATCNDIIYDNRSCPANLFWDDFRKRCEHQSPTCPPGKTNPCMSNCTGQPNGNYQSCNGCNVFATCCHGHLIDNRKCPSGTVWDDSFKRCEKTSRTCRTTTTDVETITVEKRDGLCVANCSGQADGVYQSCTDCGVYALCVNNDITIMPCPGNTVWDDALKRCHVQSSTCTKLMKVLLHQ